MGYSRLGYSRVKECPTAQELPVGVRNTKTTVKIRKKNATLLSTHDPKLKGLYYDNIKVLKNINQSNYH